MIERDIDARIAELERQIEVVKADRDVKAEIEDHHGVRDAAVDIETKLARIDELFRVLKIL
jgi:hypothetical protein